MIGTLSPGGEGDTGRVGLSLSRRCRCCSSARGILVSLMDAFATFELQHEGNGADAKSCSEAVPFVKAQD